MRRDPARGYSAILPVTERARSSPHTNSLLKTSESGQPEIGFESRSLSLVNFKHMKNGNSLDSIRIASPCPVRNLEVIVEVASALMGVVGIIAVDQPIDTPPGTLIINQKMIQRLPIH